MSGQIREGATFSTSMIVHMIDVTNRFREAWLLARSPRIEDYLGDTAGEERRSLLLDLLGLEIDFLLQRGESPDREAYRARFPDDPDLVDAIWNEMGLDIATGPFAPGSSAGGPTFELPACPNGTTLKEDITTRRWDSRDLEVSVVPPKIGRYRIDEILGDGGYGRVYRAFDEELNRGVAIKVPHPRRVSRASDIESYLAEARIVAGLDHPGIVPVYDFGRTDDGLCFMVSKFLEGGDLSRKIRLERLSHQSVAAILADVADAVEHAHANGLVHRDIKPRNLLLDLAGRPHLADFGAALREVDYGTGPGFAGTPFYMSPEQARGEGHLVDGRSDIFSLGVVLYEMLTGTRPFKGATWQQTVELIKVLEPRPPRHIDPTIPLELERICMQALCKRVSDRYPSARAMGEDLRHFLSRSESAKAIPSAAPALVPKGPRSFEAGDAESYLRLLPGARDRDGLPASLGFWLGRITGPDEDDPLRVGLVYGPSGCGKSSFVKAGLIPRLPRRVVPLLVEAMPEGTEDRVIAGIRRRFPDLPGGDDLPRMLSSIRNGEGPPEGHQLLIVLDQFEQHLHAKDDTDFSKLAEALRQCDGRRIRCLAIVRVDFWMSISRFFRELDIPLVEGKNSAAVDLFDLKHARRVLEEFGRAFEALPPVHVELSPEQSAFLDGATAGLAGDAKVSPVQLSLFAEMVKGKVWAPATLEALGGAEGVGVAFLEETFSVASSPIENRLHEAAARAVLEALLPGPGADIKGSTRPRSELLRVSGYSGRPGEFDHLERILDQELRLITQVDPEGEGDESGEPCYQLTHDYLVPSLREWLTRKLRETRQGRALFCLAQRASLWNARHERKQLPTFFEWLNIRLFTSPARWDDGEAAMMKATDRTYAASSLLGLLSMGLIILLGLAASSRMRSDALLEGLRTADPDHVPAIVEQMAPYRRWVDPPLRLRLAAAVPDSREALRYQLALLPDDPSQVTPLARQVFAAHPGDVHVILKALEGRQSSVIELFWDDLLDEEAHGSRKVRAASALAAFAPGDPRWPSVAADVVEALTAEDLFSIVHWSELLKPVREHLLSDLKSTFMTHGADSKGDIAATLLAEYAPDRPRLLGELIVSAPRQPDVLITKLRAQGESTVSPLAAELAKIARGEGEVEPVPRQDDPLAKPEDEKSRRANRRTNAAMALKSLGHMAEYWTLLKVEEDPRCRTNLIRSMGRIGVDPTEALRQLHVEPEPTVRQAILLGLGGYPENSLSNARRKSSVPELLTMYKDDPDPGVHSAVEWLLTRWDFGDQLRPVVEALGREGDKPGPKRWFVNSAGDTMVVVPGPTVFRMGDDSIGTRTRNKPHLRRIDRTFAVASKEVTVRQYLDLFPDHDYDRQTSPGDDCPINRITWFDAARYCRRLSERENIKEEDMCYPKVKDIDFGMVMKPDYLKRSGYRLLTEAEWEAAARAGTTSSQFYGSDPSVEILKLFSWSAHNTARMQPVGRTMPNAFGLFDVLGNAYDRCHDASALYPVVKAGAVRDDGIPSELIEAKTPRVIRGGAFHCYNDMLKSGDRHSTEADNKSEYLGFRIARTRP